jgi:3D (Asp-Asp-Asp) domain-containing protein
MKMPTRALDAIKRRLRLRRAAVQSGIGLLALSATVGSAIWAKERGFAPPLAAVSLERVSTARGLTSHAGHTHHNAFTDARSAGGRMLSFAGETPGSSGEANEPDAAPSHAKDPSPEATRLPNTRADSHAGTHPAPGSERQPAPRVGDRDIGASQDIDSDPSEIPVGSLDEAGAIRWFNGRPVRPAKKIWMTVTAYSPDARSCGDSADGITATLHCVTTNAFKLVAADPRVLRYGSMISVPGYDQHQIVPVLDCGGKIKGNRLDVLFPTHEEARRWGTQRLLVTVWAYADGKPAENPREERE